MKFLKGARSTFSKAISPLKEVLINCAFVSYLFAVAGILKDLFQRFHFSVHNLLFDRFVFYLSILLNIHFQHQATQKCDKSVRLLMLNPS